jgi:hypothetical protein
MSLKRLTLFTLALVILATSAFIIITEPAFADTDPAIGPADEFPILPKTGERDLSHPSLLEFRTTLEYGSRNRIVGIYAPGNFALPVVQQPSSNPGFVSTEPEVLTQFGLASEYGTLGFLAHNTLSGVNFFDLKVGQTIVLVSGDGSLKTFIISEQLSYQALSPTSPYSDFRDLNDTSIEITSTDLFNQIYAEKGKLVFQTCIASNGVENWGRYFVIAVPAGRIPHYGHSLLQTRGLSLN